ncbi:MULTISPECIES: hypothetical protein [unclassified Variovorax]|uniref:hypothetical protein n=1 Tax=unclassified Variovorax TaxID=663243 RepID=UPI003F448016
MATANPKTAVVTKAANSTTVAGKTAKPAVVIANTTAETGLPAGFVSPFTRVEMEPKIRLDDGMSCIAIIVRQSLDTIMTDAIKQGLAPHAPDWPYAPMLVAILRQYGFNAEEKECSTIDALPDVALITAEYNPAKQFGRWVLWHHVRATEKTQSFHYIIDPAHWIEPKYQVTTEIQRLITPKSPIYYIEVSAKAAGKAGKSATK